VHGTVPHVERLVRAFRRSQEVEELSRETRQQANRKLLWYHDADGSLVLHGRLPAEVGALLLRALQAAMEEQPAPDISCEPSAPAPRLGARRADALGVLAESFLRHGAEALNGGDRQQIVVHVDAETLRASNAPAVSRPQPGDL
jgi:hypothetical protein